MWFKEYRLKEKEGDQKEDFNILKGYENIDGNISFM